MTSSGQQLAREGAARAADNAERECPGWNELAIQAFCRHALVNPMFTTEDVRLSSPEVPAIRNNQSWGNVATTCVKKGVCQSSGKFSKSKLPGSHGRDIRVWKSNIVQGEA